MNRMTEMQLSAHSRGNKPKRTQLDLFPRKRALYQVRADLQILRHTFEKVSVESVVVRNVFKNVRPEHN